MVFAPQLKRARPTQSASARGGYLLNGDVLMGEGSAVAARLRQDSYRTGFFDPLPGRQGKPVHGRRSFQTRRIRRDQARDCLGSASMIDEVQVLALWTIPPVVVHQRTPTSANRYPATDPSARRALQAARFEPVEDFLSGALPVGLQHYRMPEPVQQAVLGAEQRRRRLRERR